MEYIREVLDSILEEENKKEIDAELYDDDWTKEDEEDFNTYDEDDPITPEQEAFANEIRSLLQSLIDKEEQDDDELEEKFTSQQSLTNHFNRHCLANTPNRKSTKSNIYYDFTSVKQYSNYEQKLYNIFRQGVSNSKERYDFIDDIFNVNDINKKFTKLFEGNFTLFISGIFGLRNSKGTVNLGIHAFSSDVTTNYTGGNTLDICILTSSPKTITLYPVDAATIKKEIVRIINKYSQLSLTPSKDDKKLLDNLNEREDEDLKETSPYTNIKSNGVYSLNTGWVKHPVQQDIPDIDMEEFEKEFKVWEDKYFDLLDELGKSTNEITESTKVSDEWKKELLSFVDLKLQNQEEVYSEEIRTQSKDNSSSKYIHLNFVNSIDMYNELKLNGYDVKWIEKNISFIVKR